MDFQRGDDVLLKVTPDALQDWHDWLAWERRDLLERYLTLQAQIHLHFGVGLNRGGSVAGDYCAALHFAPLPDHLELFHFDVSTAQTDPHATEFGQENGAVLVDAVEFIQLPEGVGSVPLPSLMRLQVLDDCLSGWSDAPDPLRLFVGAHGPVREDREFGALFVTGRERIRISDCKFERQMIERASEVVDAIPDETTEHAEGQLLDPYDVAASVRIGFVGEEVRMRFLPPLGPFQGIEVLARPIKFQTVAGGRDHADSMPQRSRIDYRSTSPDGVQGLSSSAAISSAVQT